MTEEAFPDIMKDADVQNEEKLLAWYTIEPSRVYHKIANFPFTHSHGDFLA